MEQEAIRRLLEAAEQCKGDEPEIMRVIDELERHTAEEHSPALLYALAYAWYLHPRRVEDASIQSRVEELLHQVLEQIPSDYLSLLYLGHNRFDCGDYITADKYFTRAKEIAPREYIGLKAYEMLVCSKIMSSDADGALEELSAFVREASSSSYEKEDIWPRELALALERRGLESLSAVKFAKAVDLADRLDQAGELNGWLGGILRRTSAAPRGLIS
jgi:tetratricopeptide (TPR) repeat protein